MLLCVEMSWGGRCKQRCALFNNSVGNARTKRSQYANSAILGSGNVHVCANPAKALSRAAPLNAFDIGKSKWTTFWRSHFSWRPTQRR